MTANNLIKKFQNIELSVFFPAFNEEQNIQNTVIKAVKVLEDLGLKKYEILVINDGSKDKTAEKAEELTKINHLIRLINHSQNLGYGEALKTGFKNAKHPWVVFQDSDGQFDFSEVSNLLEQTENADLILGFRLNRADSFLRKFYTFGWKTLAKILLGLSVRDYSCGFKLIKKEVFDAVSPLQASEKVTQIEFLVKAQRIGFRFKEVGVHHFPRKYGTPTGAKIKIVIRSIIDLFKLWGKLR